jgi:hypothetical protein
MRLWRRRVRDEEEITTAERAVLASREHLERVVARGQEVSLVAGKLKDIRHENHFSERVRAMLAAERDRGHAHGG